jgi:predicted ATPase
LYLPFFFFLQVPADVTNKIFKRSEGNPFVTEELVSALKESGILKVKNGQCKMKDDKGPGALSFTLQALLTSKVDKLAPEQQRVLKVR